jgi:hypothetical protein
MDKSDFLKWKRRTELQLTSLKSALTSSGSNLLVVGGISERIIPSFSRVLHVNKVVICQQDRMKTRCPEPLNEFKNNIADKVKFELKMHSIDFHLEAIKSPDLRSNMPLPPFPEINTCFSLKNTLYT